MISKISKDADWLETEKLHWFRQQLTIWADDNLRDFPWRRTTDPYAIFVAEFLLQKTDAAKVVPIYETFLARYPTIESLSLASVTEVVTLLQPLGLHFRAKRLCESVQKINAFYDGKIPDAEAQLLALPGVGKYTARSICAHAFGQQQVILDTNVARILERFFGLQGGRVKSRCKILWKAAEQVAPHEEVGKWNLTLLDFGATVCTARKPHCGKCPLQEHCNYLRLN
ncbi:A/G-specific adenine glycosylase [Chroococcidiopsis sp. TS-821]|uniref:A/G-specific adenine glycosylase n=1 Tax=Chroococcidiopsis sp. TS-821 TaxID=1378066 RepID=UPI000CEE6A8C|nr:A/G-specific adenine glycosylase [Chroococcidiopsis sp. TS-821]